MCRYGSFFPRFVKGDGVCAVTALSSHGEKLRGLTLRTVVKFVKPSLLKVVLKEQGTASEVILLISSLLHVKEEMEIYPALYGVALSLCVVCRLICPLPLKLRNGGTGYTPDTGVGCEDGLRRVREDAGV